MRCPTPSPAPAPCEYSTLPTPPSLSLPFPFPLHNPLTHPKPSLPLSLPPFQTINDSIDFKIKNLELDGKRIKLQIWDTAGQERFRTITTSYFRGAQGILLVYDVTDRRSFESIRNWVGQIQQHADVHVNKILIGNKCDMTPQRVVTTEEGQSLANDFGIQFFETSAKNDINVEKSFVTIAREVKNRMLVDGGPRATGGKAIVDAKKVSDAKKCC